MHLWVSIPNLTHVSNRYFCAPGALFKCAYFLFPVLPHWWYVFVRTLGTTRLTHPTASWLKNKTARIHSPYLIHCGDWQTFRGTTTRPDHVRPEVRAKIGKAGQNREKQELKKKEATTWQCSTTERNLLYWSWWPRLQRNFQKCEEKIGKTYGSSHAVQKESSDWHHEGGRGGNCIPKCSKNDLWLYGGITLQAKDLPRWPITIWFTNLFLCFKRW